MALEQLDPHRRLLLTTAETAEALGVQPATLRDWSRRGLAKPVRRNRWDLHEARTAQRAAKPRRTSDTT